MVRPLLLAVALLTILPVFAADVPLVARGAAWRYLDSGTDQGTAWRAGSFDDSFWLKREAQLGYGDGDERTVVSYGANPSQKHITTYFRRTFTVADPSVFVSIALQTLRDDGAVVYLNGTEVWRDNMPTGTTGYRTLALVGVGGTDETVFQTASIDPSLVLAGANIVAVEIHQHEASSTDLSFDLQLTASTSAVAAVLTRGPYLQMGTPTQMRIRWRTSIPTNSRVRYGTQTGNLPLVVDDPTMTTEHEVLLSSLSNATRYFYSIGSTAQTIAGSDASHTFMTSPAAGSTIPTRIWVLGDSGTANADAAAVRNAYQNFAGSSTTNLWLMLGDNAYQNGTDAEYQRAVFDMYPAMLRQSVLWPTLGNHDTAGLTAVSPTLPYFAMFSLPTAGEAGGVASGTEKYYSFDYANIHFVCLDSMTSNRSVTGAMLTWLEEDLASTTQPWIIAFWHHPPYSKGSHDSDTEELLAEMRRNALPILEDYGVDLVLAGHSHSYERSFLIDSHYSTSSNFISSMKKNGGSGRPEGTGAYRKSTVGAAAHEGAVYAVAGSSGRVSPGPLNHPAMFISMAALGSMVLDVEGNRLDAKFLRENGAIDDSFTIIKVPSTGRRRPSASR